jgi:hypothetical protein
MWPSRAPRGALCHVGSGRGAGWCRAGVAGPIGDGCLSPVAVAGSTDQVEFRGPAIGESASLVVAGRVELVISYPLYSFYSPGNMWHMKYLDKH